MALLQRQFEQTKSGLQEDTGEPLKVLELAQHLSRQYVTLKPPQKRQIADSVFSNLDIDDITLCAEYRLPFAILAKNTNRPLNYGWVDDYRTAVFVHPVTLDLLEVA